MGSSESSISANRSTVRAEKNPLRSRISRFLLFKKLDYLQWICTVAVFLLFVVMFQMFLPGSVVEKSEDVRDGLRFERVKAKLGLGDVEEFEFVPLRLMRKFRREVNEVNRSGVGVGMERFGDRKPRLALVFADLLVDPQQVLMVTVAAALQDIGYDIEVYSVEGGPVHDIWTRLGIPVSVFNGKTDVVVDWLSYDGIVVNSFEAKSVFLRLMQEPFKFVPLIWVVHESTLATRLRQYTSSRQTENELLNDWKKVFNRALVVVFPNYFLPMMYSTFDSGNYYVIPGVPGNTWEAKNIMSSNKDELRIRMGFQSHDVVVAIVGSEFVYKGMWLDHAVILEALFPLCQQLSFNEDSNSHLKVMILSRDPMGNYSKALEGISQSLRYPKGAVKHIPIERDADAAIYMADLVIYGTFLEEHSFPDILTKAMLLAKPIIAPDLSVIRKYVDDRVNGYLYPKGNTEVLSQIMSRVVLNGKVAPLAHKVASVGRSSTKKLMASEAVEEYAQLLENVLKLPSEVALPKPASDVSPKLREEWQWSLFEALSDLTYPDRSLRVDSSFSMVNQQLNHTRKANYNPATPIDESYIYEFWEEQKKLDIANAIKSREEAELKDRSDQPHGTWDEVYRNVKKADRSKNDLHERDDGELERTGQPLTIYEPYYGEGIWPFLHQSSLYRGIGLATKGRRPGADDIDAPSRLSLLNNPYYRDALGEYGAFFAIANRVDRIHKNAWIGFHSWRATARKVSLSKKAEKALLNAIQNQMHGDTLYFWVRMDKDPRNPLSKDFWSFCDAINAGNCRSAFSNSLKKMYGLKPDFNSLPPMPLDGDTWSVMHSWTLPTRSFMEFVMFSRMFADALDAQMYNEQHSNQSCYLSLSKDKHCYSRLLELLINVWAYHSARRMVYVNPDTGVMQEQHRFRSRRGHMWIKWFSYDTLKSMDEDFAEEEDLDHPSGPWLWPSTGEVLWEGIIEREKNLQRMQKEKRKQLSKEKITRMRHRKRQKTIGKYVKPPPDDLKHSNSTIIRGKVSR